MHTCRIQHPLLQLGQSCSIGGPGSWQGLPAKQALSTMIGAWDSMQYIQCFSDIYSDRLPLWLQQQLPWGPQEIIGTSLAHCRDQRQHLLQAVFGCAHLACGQPARVEAKSETRVPVCSAKQLRGEKPITCNVDMLRADNTLSWVPQRGKP